MSNETSLVKGKVPPQAVDLEEVVLGAMLIDKNSMDEVMLFMTAEMFYKNPHKLIFKAIRKLYLEETGIDLLTVEEQLKKTKELEKAGGIIYLMELTQKVSSSAHVEFHSRIIFQEYIKRQLISNSNLIIEDSYDRGKDPLDLLENAYNHLGNISNLIVPTKKTNIRELVADIVSHAGKLHRKEVEPGIKTPIIKLTNKMGGWRPAELIILAARPGMGKTAFALKTGWLAALNGIPTAFFSLEMSSTQLMSRVISMDCRIDGSKLQQDGLNPSEERQVIERMSEADKIPFHIDDTSSLNIHMLQTKAKKLKKENNIRLLIVDYLQLMDGTGKGSGRNREQEISEISRGLKKISMDLHIPVIALSQLSRAVETRGGSKRPMLSDLRESGAIEQDADVVGFIYRPEYYGISEWDDYDGVPCQGEAEYIIAKNRNGGLVRNRMRFEARYTLFSDIDEEYQEEEFIPPPPKNLMPNEAFGNTPEPSEEEDDLPF